MPFCPLYSLPLALAGLRFMFVLWHSVSRLDLPHTEGRKLGLFISQRWLPTVNETINIIIMLMLYNNDNREHDHYQLRLRLRLVVSRVIYACSGIISFPTASPLELRLRHVAPFPPSPLKAWLKFFSS